MVVDIVGVVPIVRESTESRPIQVHSEWGMGGDQHVDTHVELLVADEEGVMDVALNDVCFGLVGWVCPVGYFADLSEEEDALALAASDLPSTTRTGFMIHTSFCSRQRLNSSRKMGYSPGRLYVSGR